MAVKGPRNYQPQAGVGTDTAGGPLIDPTKNVLDLVKAESKYQDAMRQAETDRLDDLAQAETHRIDQLAELRRDYEKRIADIQNEGVRDKSALVSSQLLQIQSTFDIRLTRLEQYQLLSTGRSQVADPAMADAMSRMASTIATMKEDETLAISKMSASLAAITQAGVGVTSKSMGRGEIVSYIFMGVLVLSQIVGIIGVFVTISRLAH